MFYSKRNRQRIKLAGSVIALLIIFIFVVGLFAPNLRSSRNSGSVPTFTPFGTPAPPTPVILPTPNPNPRFEGELPYIHSSGYFQVFLPAGDDWVVSERLPEGDTPYPTVFIQSQQRLVVIHNYIQPGVEYESLESLSENLLTTEYFATNWADYDSWQETNRLVSDNAVSVDFDLVASENNYLGRDISWLESDQLYVTRLVVPGNDPDLLGMLDELVTSGFVGYPDLQALPRAWPIYTDQELGFIFKHPAGWQVIAGGSGRPVTFSASANQDEAVVRIWTVPNQPVESAEQAEAWLTETEPSATILGNAPAERAIGTGYQIAYAYRDTAGDAHSGLVVLLNDADNTLFVANLQLDPPEIDMFDVQNLSLLNNDIRQALVNGFVILFPGARQTSSSAPPAESNE